MSNAATAVAVALIVSTAGCQHAVVIRDPELLTFAGQKHQQTETLARALNLRVPSEMHLFFDAAEAGNWAAVSNRFARITALSRAVAEGNTGSVLDSAAWVPVHEVYGAFHEYTRWDTALRQKYARALLDDLPAGSIYFGGTDPGRFIITAVRDTADAPDIIILTQNAVTDHRYLEYLRRVHGKRIWVPTEQDVGAAFSRYVQELQSGGRSLDEGVGGVMAIISVTTKQIFQHNKKDHEFFVVESFVIPWMYPHLEPHGLILKLRKEPLSQLDPAVVARDRAYWDGLTRELLGDERFRRDRAAPKTFAKLRSAIGGVYKFRQLHAESEHAFRQAIELCPSCVEGVYRLTQCYVEQKRFDEALSTLAAFEKELGPGEADTLRVRELIQTVRTQQRDDQTRETR
ncbi:hypothetical protein HQ590_14835 [bacterium]|nr:hypothetical protein [bacterium]